MVESVAKDSNGEQVDLQPGDIVDSWARGDQQGRIESPFDFTWIETEQAPRGAVTLEGKRGRANMAWVLRREGWNVKTMPVWPEPLAVLYQRGRTLAQAGNADEASATWHEIATQPGGLVPSCLATWATVHAAELLAEKKLWKSAGDLFAEAASKADDCKPWVLEQILSSWSQALDQQGDWKAAEEKIDRILAQKSRPAETLSSALLFYKVALMAQKQGNLSKAEDYLFRSLALREHLAPGSRALSATYNTLGGVSYRRGNLRESAKWYSLALAIMEKLAPEDTQCGTSLLGLGAVEFRLGHFSLAETHYRRALLIYQKAAPKSSRISTILDSLGNIKDEQGDLAAAEELYLEALHTAQESAPDGPEMAWALTGLGVVSAEQGELVKAEEYHQRAFVIRSKLNPEGLDVTSSLTNLGTVAMMRGELRKAEQYYQQVLAIAEKHQSPDDMAASLSSLGIVAYRLGDLIKAEQYLDKALSTEQSLAPDGLEAARILNNLGMVAQSRNDWRTAERQYRKALGIRARITPGSLEEAETLGNLAELVRDRGDWARASKYLERVIRIEEKSAPGGLSLAATYASLSRLLYQRGNLNAADRYALRAATLQRRVAPDGADLAGTLKNLGDIEAVRGNFDSANQHYMQALAILGKLTPSNADYVDALAAMAEIKFKKGDVSGAAGLFKECLRALETQTGYLGGPDAARWDFRAKRISYYKKYIDLLMRNKEVGPAFTVAEQSRAHVLLETLQAGRIKLFKGTEPGLVEEERSLRELISGKADARIRLLSGKHTTQSLATAKQEIDDLIAQYDELEAKIRAENPDSAALLQPHTLTVQEIQTQLLDENTLLLEYILGDERSYVWALSPSTITCYELPARSRIERVARWTSKSVTGARSVHGSSSTFGSSARQSAAQSPDALTTLGNMIVKPLAAQLGNKRLLIVTDEVLQHIPFAALPDPNTHQPLILKHEIVHLPSVSVLEALRRVDIKRQSPSKTLAVFADPVFDSTDERVVRQATRPGKAGSTSKLPARSSETVRSMERQKLTLPRLPFSRREAESIVDMMPEGTAMKALDFDATRDAAMNPMLAQYKIVHFATHGLSDGDDPELSGIVLSLVDEHGKPKQGFLGLRDIYNLNLPADLIVLSACESGLGKDVRGEGVISLARAFMYAGAHRVIASLWQIDDLATSVLMAKFYKAVHEDGLRPAAALRRAQEEIRNQKQWRSPYYWAAFQIYGEWK